MSNNISGMGGLELNAELRQPKTTNGLLPTSYKFTLARAPQLTYFCNSLSIPTLSLEKGMQLTPMTDVSHPAGVMGFEDLTINFIVDEQMSNWIEVYDWMKSLVPSDVAELRNDIKKTGIVEPKNRFSDLSVIVTTNQSNGQIIIKFKNAYPISLGEIEFTSIVSDVDPVTSNVSFAYDTYSVEVIS